MDQNQNKNKHQSVLSEAVITYLDPKAGESYLDVTAGYGGHAALVLARTKPTTKHQAVLIDRDPQAVATLTDRFNSQPVDIRRADYVSVMKALIEEGRQFDLILADLGVSSPHLNEAERGFAFRLDGPLDMRMDQQQVQTAEELINHLSEADLADLLKTYGEEPQAERIAKALVRNRPIHRTTELAEIISHTIPRGNKRIHPATRTFQALRIAVNDELSQLETALPLWINLLAPGGRLAVISFHSLEDRLVKETFRDLAGDRYDAIVHLLTKRPVTASSHELAINPRARSAKLRAVAKTNMKGA